MRGHHRPDPRTEEQLEAGRQNNVEETEDRIIRRRPGTEQ
jgi:hypothetical protein